MANNPNMAMMMAAQARRRRDGRGRYMEYLMTNAYNRAPQYPRRNEMPQGYSRGNDMMRSYSRRMEEPQQMRRHYAEYTTDRPDMKGEGYFTWDSMDPMDYEDPAQYYSPYGDQPDVYRQQEEWPSDNVAYFEDYSQSGGRMPRSQQYTAGRQIGFQSNGEERFDKETAHEWVENMKDSSGNVGGKYSWSQAHQYAVNKGITSDKKIAEFYAAMNAMYSDFHAAGEKFGVDTPDFYACLAKLFMDDPDAVNDKMAMYYKYIVKHEE
jgi:hypothetical protein